MGGKAPKDIRNNLGHLFGFITFDLWAHNLTKSYDVLDVPTSYLQGRGPQHFGHCLQDVHLVFYGYVGGQEAKIRLEW